jgi:signal transduction histidine kinase
MMRNSLFFKLIGAFLLVTVIGTLVITVLVSRSTGEAFTLYTNRRGEIWAERLAPVLATYYSSKNSWEGVAAYLQSGIVQEYAPAGNGQTMGQGNGPNSGNQGGSGMSLALSLDQRLVLADVQGLVVSDSLNEMVGETVSAASLSAGTPVLAAGIQVGTLIITPLDSTGITSASGEFLASVNQAIIKSGVIAGGIALVLGALLFFQITAPLRQLKKAAAKIAQGDLSQRVKVTTRDEFGQVGLTFNHMVESLSNQEIQRQHMVADIAHELRTPLTAIQGTLEGIQDGVFSMDEEQVSALYAETTLLNRLVGDLRLLSLAETGQLKLDLKKVEPGALLAQIAERIRPQARQKDIQLITEIAGNLPIVLLDADRITQVITNLIANALRYTPVGGTITLQAAFRPATHRLEIGVADTGSGIAPEDLPFIFDRFYRADKSRTRVSGGSGLGLAIVKQLVEAHGGRVRVECPAGGGTKFTLEIPG